MTKTSLFLCSTFLLAACVPSQMGRNVLLFDRPAEYWEEAMPVGNGRLGAMVYGSVEEEEIQLNEDTIWQGEPYNNFNPAALELLPEVRQLIFDGKYKEAQDLCENNFISPVGREMAYGTVGSLKIRFEDRAEPVSYSRKLDIDNAIASTDYTLADGTDVSSEVFASFSDQMIVVRLKSSKAFSCSLGYSSPMPGTKQSVTADGLLRLEGRGRDADCFKGAIRYVADTKVDSKGGAVQRADSLLRAENVSELTLHIAVSTNFVNYRDVSGDPYLRNAETLKNAAKPYGKAKAENIAFYKSLSGRVTLDLGHTDLAEQTVESRLKSFRNNWDPDLISTYFQFGRYLLVCCSQPGTQPANLQGIWNASPTPPWCGNYTTNINTEMNYWPAEVTNLPEMHEPLLQMIKELAVSGAETARQMYGCRGWVLHHNSDLWRCTGALDKASCGVWPAAGAWMCRHLWDRYLFSKDVDYLREYYPVMKSACEFFVDFMVKDPSTGHLVVVPSNSPENTPRGKGASLYAGVTIDNQMIRDLFTNTISASETLGGIDREFCDTLAIMRAQLTPTQVGQHQQIQEWAQDWDSPEDHHRHISHLWGLYPGVEISAFNSPELFDAAVVTLGHRTDASTGWSMGWKVCSWARMLDGDHAFKLIRDQLSYVSPVRQSGQGGGTYPNLFDAHPPFQIDGNFGCTAGIAEMLVQSHEGYIRVLPALPEQWSEGVVKGLRARDGFVVEELRWKDGKPAKIVVRATVEAPLEIRAFGRYDDTLIYKREPGDKDYLIKPGQRVTVRL